jgi:hypothetical protein
LRHTIENRGDIHKNVLEKIGDAGLWFVEEFPRKVWHVAKDPRVVTIALTAMALLATSFIFYPSTTWFVVRTVITSCIVPPLWAVKFSAYIATVGIIVAGACRAEGRFINSKLMKAFYGAEHVS